MSLFLDQFEKRAGDDLATLLVDIIRLPDGTLVDAAAWDDWVACVRNVIQRREPPGDSV